MKRQKELKIVAGELQLQRDVMVRYCLNTALHLLTRPRAKARKRK